MPLYINVGSQGYLDGIDIKRDEFYKKLPTFPVQPTTAIPYMQKFRAMYEALADEGASEVLSIHISTSLSAIVNVARLENSSIVDIFWGTGFVIANWVYFALTPEGFLPRKLLLGALVTLWGLRLSIHILLRNWGKPEDFRYQK